MNNRDEQGTTQTFSRNWLVLFLTLALLGMAFLLLQILDGGSVASSATNVGFVVIAAFALVDGGWRLVGKGGFLGSGRGLDRMLALIQVILAMGVLARFVA